MSSPESHTERLLKILGRLTRSSLGKRALALNASRLVPVIMESLNAKALAARASAALV